MWNKQKKRKKILNENTHTHTKHYCLIDMIFLAIFILCTSVQAYICCCCCCCFQKIFLRFHLQNITGFKEKLFLFLFASFKRLLLGCFFFFFFLLQNNWQHLFYFMQLSCNILRFLFSVPFFLSIKITVWLQIFVEICFKCFNYTLVMFFLMIIKQFITLFLY